VVISEAIRLLERVKHIHGDIEVVYLSPKSGDFRGFTDIRPSTGENIWLSLSLNRPVCLMVSEE
jgi:hypothetical protein